MTAFATPAELASWLQVASVDTATSNLQLNIASSAIRTYCGWDITSTDVTGEEIDGPGHESVWLPTLKLTAIGPVVVDGKTLVDGTDYDWTSYGRIRRLGTCWPRDPRSVTVTYTHGYTEVPDVVKGVCLAVAGRAYLNPTAARQTTDTAGPFTRTQSYSGDVDTSMFEPAELKSLSKFRIQAIA